MRVLEIFVRRFNFDFSVELSLLEDGIIDVWHNTEDGREIKVNSFSSIDVDANIENAKNWVFDFFLPNNYDAYEIRHIFEQKIN